jgi:methylated-DNA-[protein]-cysteine S-methyltransferase
LGKALIFKTRYGYSAVLYTESPFEIFRTFLPRPKQEDLIKAVDAVGFFEKGSHESARRVSRSIADYFQGRPLEIDWPPWPWVTLGGLTPLQQSVLRETAKIPYGTLRSYKDIAAAIDRPRACRFVGSTLAKNPLPLLIPCHRVIRSDGTPGQFGGGTPLKQALIDLERRCANNLT